MMMMMMILRILLLLLSKAPVLEFLSQLFCRLAAADEWLCLLWRLERVVMWYENTEFLSALMWHVNTLSWIYIHQT